MKKKILILLPVLLLGGGYVAKGKLMPAKVVKPKLAGEIYIMPKQFMCNLQDGHYATLTVALELAPGQSDGATAADAGTSTGSTVGTLPEEAVIRAIITNLITNQTSNTLVTDSGRNNLESEILSQIKSQTDVKIDEVFFTDVAVQ
ncbi:MAG: flagellar basal body-associated FliL family protein [Solirubrobacterales bacterium]|nr:flagellar basal body-associated FliL family protein [Solirubrobacterales bacterium]